MKYKLPLALFVLVLFTAATQAQANLQKEPLKHVEYNQNVDNPLTSKELHQLREVYGTYLKEYILNKPQRLKDVKNILRNRVVIYQAPDKDLSSLKDLSQVPLFTAYNKSLTRDLNIDSNNFNPLKYQFNFYSRKGETFRSGNTIIVIIPQHQNL